MAHSPLEILGWFGLGFTVVMTIAWAISLRLNFFSLVDAVWAIGIGVGAALLALFYSENLERTLFVAGLGLFWGLRLGIHLALRLSRHFPNEDARYQSLRSLWKQGLGWKTFLFFVFQALTQTLFLYPFMVLALDSQDFPQPLEILGGAIAILAILGETLADAQLKQFKLNPAHQKKVCNVGLWRYSRHPNYFFEWLIWCGIAVAALQSSFGFYAILCPVIMLILLWFITGVRPSEIQSLKSRGEAYREYQRTTSAFIPWIPKPQSKEAKES